MKRTKLPIEFIVQEENSRSTYRDQDLQELMGSMKRHGLLHPIGVKKISGDEYEVVFGNRRFVAAEKLGWHEIDVTVVESATDAHRDILNLVENLRRSDITAHDEGRILLNLIKSGLTEAEVAVRVGTTVKRVKDSIEVFKSVPRELRDRIVPTMQAGRKHQGRVPASVMSKLSGIARETRMTAGERNAFFNKAVSTGASLRMVGNIARFVKGGIPVEEAFDKANNLYCTTLWITADLDVMRKLEKKYKVKYADLLTQHLYARKEFGIKTKRNSTTVTPGGLQYKKAVLISNKRNGAAGTKTWVRGSKDNRESSRA